MKTPKGKAESLSGMMRRDNEMPAEYAKQCASISVRDTISVLENLLEDIDNSSDIGISIVGNIAYYREVEKEISEVKF